jgi:hypothetical protein
MEHKTTVKSLLVTLGLLVYIILFAFFKNNIFTFTNLIISVYVLVLIMIALYQDIRFDRIPKDTVNASSQGVQTDDTTGVSKTIYRYLYQGSESLYTCTSQEVKMRLNLDQVTLEISKDDPSNIRISRKHIRRKNYFFMGVLGFLALWILVQGVIRIISL